MWLFVHVAIKVNLSKIAPYNRPSASISSILFSKCIGYRPSTLTDNCLSVDEAFWWSVIEPSGSVRTSAVPWMIRLFQQSTLGRSSPKRRKSGLWNSLVDDEWRTRDLRHARLDALHRRKDLCDGPGSRWSQEGRHKTAYQFGGWGYYLGTLYGS